MCVMKMSLCVCVCFAVWLSWSDSDWQEGVDRERLSSMRLGWLDGWMDEDRKRDPSAPWECQGTSPAVAGMETESAVFGLLTAS